MMIAVVVMVCGFAVSTRVEVPTVEKVEPVEVVTFVAPEIVVTPFDPVVERENLLADEEALYRATLWLARCIYSETGRRREQELVAWVVRNRAETRYRGESDYSRVVMDPYQFSAFNRQSATREFLLTIDTTYASPGWQSALRVARHVIEADPSERPEVSDEV